MLNLMMIAGTLFESQARRLGDTFFRLCFTGLATLAPQVQLAYAAISTGDAAQRAQLMVTGCERIVLALAVGLLLRAAFGAIVVRRPALQSGGARDALHASA